MAAGRESALLTLLHIVLEPNLNLNLNLNKKIDLKFGRHEKSTDTSVSKALHHITDVMPRIKIKIKN